MQSISEFNPNLSVAILLVGGAGTGKTALALRLFPKTYAFIADLNFQSGIRYLKEKNCLSNVVGFDTATPDENGKAVKPLMRYQRMLEKTDAAFKSAEVDAVVWDSSTFIEDIIKAKICGAMTDEAIKLNGFEQWGQLMLVWKSLILQARQSGKKFIMTAHEQKEKDESDQIFRYQIAVDGSIRGKFPALFSDVWRCEVAELNNVHKWQVRTLGNIRQEHLKNTYGFQPLMDHDSVIAAVRK